MVEGVGAGRVKHGIIFTLAVLVLGLAKVGEIDSVSLEKAGDTGAKLATFFGFLACAGYRFGKEDIGNQFSGVCIGAGLVGVFFYAASCLPGLAGEASLEK